MNTFFNKPIQPRKKFDIIGIYTSIDKKCEPGFVFSGESHPFWEILYIKSGMVEVVEDEKTYILYEGNLICHAPNEFHRIKSAGGTAPHICVLTIQNTGSLPEAISNGVFALLLDMREQFEKCFKQLFFLCHERGGHSSYHNDQCSSDNLFLTEVGNPDKIGHEGLARLTVFLLTLSYMSANSSQISTSHRAREYSRLVATMSEKIYSGLTLDRIAEIHHISKSYITKLFKSYAGEGPMKYYSRLRISKIQELLQNGMSLSDIVEKMNFSSSAYLSSFFKEKCGLSPSEWLKSVKDKNT